MTEASEAVTAPQVLPTSWVISLYHDNQVLAMQARTQPTLQVTTLVPSQIGMQLTIHKQSTG